MSKFDKRETRFDERELKSLETCVTCKHCYQFEVYYSYENVRTDEPFCMLDVPKKDFTYLYTEEAPFNSDGPYSERLMEIMKIKDGDDLIDSPRLMSPVNCCQFHHKLNNGEKNE